MKKQQIKKSLKEYAEQLSEENLNAVYQFSSYLVERERKEATQELLEIPALLAEIDAARQDIVQGHLTDWREVRTDV